jgi:hypothetical protein
MSAFEADRFNRSRTSPNCRWSLVGGRWSIHFCVGVQMLRLESQYLSRLVATTND